MENWDLVRIYTRAMKSMYYIEAMSVGYQLLEYIFIILLTNTTVGNNGKPLSKTQVKKADYLLKKATLALENGFINSNIFNEVEKFNRLRGGVIHKMVEKNIEYSDIKLCAGMVDPLYHEIQSLFLRITPGESQDA